MTFSDSPATRIALTLLTAAGFASCDGRRTSNAEEATFIVETIDASLKETRQTDADTRTEQKLFQFSACLLDAVARAPIARTRFQVSDGKTAKEIPTDNGGCLLWEEKHRVSGLEPERLLRIERIFTAVEGFSGTVKTELAFNPWAGELVDIRKLKELPEGLETGRHMLTFESDLQGLANASPNMTTVANVFLKDISLEFIEHDKSASEITPLMTLKTAQLFRLRMSPGFIVRNYKNETVNIDPRGGSLNVWIVLTKKDPTRHEIDGEDVVAEYQGPIKVLHDGTVAQNIHLRIHDTAGVLSRNHVLVAVEPQGKMALHAKSGFFTGFISPLLGNDAGVALVPVENDVVAKLARTIDSALPAARSSIPALRALQKYSGLQPETSNPGKILLSARTSTDDKQPKHLLRSYCSELYTKDLVVHVPREGLAKIINIIDRDGMKWVNVLASCLRDPREFVRIDARDFVEAVHGKPEHVKDSTSVQYISVGRAVGFSRTRSRSETASASVSGGVSADSGIGWQAPKLPGPIFGSEPSAGLGFKIAAGADWNIAVARNRSSSTSVSTGVSEGHQFTVATDAYAIDATVRRCAIISATVGGGKKGFFACEDGTHRRRFSETYYLINHGIASSPFSDESSINNTRWRLTIRGDKMYKAFEDLMTKGNTVLEFSKLTATIDGKTKLLPDFRVTQEFPGAVLPER